MSKLTGEQIDDFVRLTLLDLWTSRLMKMFSSSREKAREQAIKLVDNPDSFELKDCIDEDVCPSCGRDMEEGC